VRGHTLICGQCVLWFIDQLLRHSAYYWIAVVALAVWLTWRPTADTTSEAESPAIARCWDDWERFDRPDEWLTECLDRADQWIDREPESISSRSSEKELSDQEWAAMERCLTEWEHSDKPTEWLSKCLDRAELRLRNEASR
jgi:hypothetical protein